MQTFLTYAAYGLVGVILILVVTITVVIIKKSSKPTTLTPPTPTPRSTPPPLPRLGWSAWTLWFKTLLILTTIGVVGALMFVPGVWKSICDAVGFGVNNPAAGVAIPMIVVTWFLYNFLNPLPPKHIITARVALWTSIICIGIWIWPLLGENKIQRIGEWWKKSVVPTLLQLKSAAGPIKQIPHQPAHPTQHVLVTNERQAVHPAGKDTRIITVRVSSTSWVPIEWTDEDHYQVFGSPRPVRVLYCRQGRMPSDKQEPGGIMELTGEDPPNIPANRSPLWVKAESSDPNTEISFDLLVGFSK